METVRDYYQYRDRLRESIKNETDEELLEEMKSELKTVDQYISKMEKEEINERKHK